jgi:excisionase family DNA binding protein
MVGVGFVIPTGESRHQPRANEAGAGRLANYFGSTAQDLRRAYPAPQSWIGTFVVITQFYNCSIPDKEATPKALLSVREVAEQFGVSRATAYRWCDTGAIPSVKVAGTVRVPTRALVDRLARSSLARSSR